MVEREWREMGGLRKRAEEGWGRWRVDGEKADVNKQLTRPELRD